MCMSVPHARDFREPGFCHFRFVQVEPLKTDRWGDGRGVGRLRGWRNTVGKWEYGYNCYYYYYY